MISVLKTEKSELLLYNIPKNNTNDEKISITDVVSACIEEIDICLSETPEIIVFGKKCKQHRCIGFFSEKSTGYCYSNSKQKSQPMTEKLKIILDWINKLFNSDFNGILVNKYRDGNDYIGKHSDNERELHPNYGVVSLSFGVSRKFRIRDKKTSKIVKDIETEHFQIMQMKGDFQNEFTHEIPIQKKVLKTRYSFTFRKHEK